MMRPNREFLRRSLGYIAALLLSLLFVIAVPASTAGADFDEYAVMAVAFAEHGSPDIRVADLQKASALLPPFAPQFEAAISGIRAGRPEAKSGIMRGRDGNYYAIHFSGYPAMVALPLKTFEALGLPAFKAFLALNTAFILVLGLSLRRFSGSWGRALGAVALFLLCGGALYWKWGSPECMTAAALLASIALFLSGAPLRAGLLAGLAGMQNPPLVAFVVFAPVLRLAACYDSGLPVRANLLRALAPRYIAGVALTGVMVALPFLANLYQFGVPSIIAKVAADPALMSVVRFRSLFLDLSSGMIVAIPGVAAALVYCWAHPAGARWRRWPILAAVAAFSAALALPTLVTTNWNSGAIGVMRYAFWIAMPLLFALIWRLNQMPRFPWVIAASLVAVQLAATGALTRYSYLQFGPAAHWVLRHAPQLYNPEPEIFVERVTGQDTGVDNSRVYTYEWQGRVRKILYHRSNIEITQTLCGPGRVLLSRSAASDRGWQYLSGTPSCERALNTDDFLAGTAVRLGQGWNRPEKNGGLWDGVWSNGTRSSLALVPPPGTRPSHLKLQGNYFGHNEHTRVVINGRDYGWQDLRMGTQFEISARDGAPIEVELEHANPLPAPGDPRRIAFFLRYISLN